MTASAIDKLCAIAVVYAAAKVAMTQTAESVARVRDTHQRILADPDGLASPDLAACEAEASTLQQALTSEIAAWRLALFDLQDASVAVVGVNRPTCTMVVSRLLSAAEAFAAAKVDIDQHKPPRTGVAYVGKRAVWRGCLQDLDTAACTYALKRKPTHEA